MADDGLSDEGGTKSKLSEGEGGLLSERKKEERQNRSLKTKSRLYIYIGVV